MALDFTLHDFIDQKLVPTFLDFKARNLGFFSNYNYLETNPIQIGKLMHTRMHIHRTNFVTFSTQFHTACGILQDTISTLSWESGGLKSARLFYQQ